MEFKSNFKKSVNEIDRFTCHKSYKGQNYNMKKKYKKSEYDDYHYEYDIKVDNSFANEEEKEDQFDRISNRNYGIPAPPINRLNKYFQIKNYGKLSFEKLLDNFIEYSQIKEVNEFIQTKFCLMNEIEKELIVDKAIECFFDLSKHYFAYYVIIHILQDCSKEQLRKITNNIFNHFNELMELKYSSKIVRQIFLRISTEEDILIKILDEIDDNIYNLFFHEYGTFAIQELITVIHQMNRFDLLEKYILPKTTGKIFTLSISQCGARVLELIYGFLNKEWKNKFIEEALLKYRSTCENIYGSYLIVTFIQDYSKNKLTVPDVFYQKIKGSLYKYSINKHTNKIISCLFDGVNYQQQNEMINEFIYFDVFTNETIIGLCRNPFATEIVQKMIHYSNQFQKSYFFRIMNSSDVKNEPMLKKCFKKLKESFQRKEKKEK